ncbi:MAG: reverse transcriptase domain-containing protein, partial [Cellulosilyticaceae bacterium]
NDFKQEISEEWFAKQINKKYHGATSMVRYADDIVFCFEKQYEAEKFYTELKERLMKFGLKLSDDKSKILKFGRFQAEESGTFDFLGFTFMMVKSRKGNFFSIHVTSQKKLKEKKKVAKAWIKENMHMPPNILIRKLNLKLRGHYNYYGVSHNMRRMRNFYRYIKTQLKKSLNRRS